MCASRATGTFAFLLGIGVASSAVADTGRVAILATEASRIAAAGPGAVSAPTSPWVLAATWAGTLAAAFFGSYLGFWRPSLGRVRDVDGWREVTYRFRSSSPLKISGPMLERMSGVLTEIENLGSRLKSYAAAEFAPSESTPPASASKQVEFVRRTDSTPRAVPVAVPGTGPASPPEARDERAARRATVQRARRLLREGHDPATVRELTGLKLAELDMIRWAPVAGEKGAA